MGWDAYYTMNAINTWIDDLAATYPDIVSIIIGGTTFEGREIKGLKISHGEGKRVIFLEGGIHSREWISPATVNYITNELLTSNDEETKAAARDFDWYIFPVTNPDGYIWSHEQVSVKTVCIVPCYEHKWGSTYFTSHNKYVNSREDSNSKCIYWNTIPA